MHAASKEQKIFLVGPQGKIETKLYDTNISNNTPSASSASSASSAPSAPNIGIVCHPHPLYQGSMDNKVVTTITRAWQGLGFNTIRFNFRGVGESEGTYGEGQGEIEDLQAVLRWAKQQYPTGVFWLAGFSFGAMISSLVAKDEPFIQGLISVAPAVQFFDLTKFSIPRCPWLIVHGAKDEIVPIESVQAWYQQLKKQAEKNKLSAIEELIILPEATHFFHGQLNELKTVTVNFTHMFT
jgi:hypothetical protein